MHPDIEILIELQGLDQEIARLSAEIAYLPKHIADIEAKLNEHVQQVESDKGVLAAHYKERKRLEAEIGIVREKISKYKDQMLAVKTNEQYKALQHEIEFAETNIRGFEDQILEKMVLDEELEAAVKKAQAKLATEKVVVEKEKAEATARTREDEKEVAERKSHRGELQAKVSESSYRLYTYLMQARKGLAITEATNSSCGGCHVLLRPQAYNEVKMNDKIRTCESCSRILYYVVPTPPEEISLTKAEATSPSTLT